MNTEERRRWEARRRSFEADADAYDRCRPGYPREMFDGIRSYADLVPDARIVEVGAGTGKASVPMASWGFPLVALEPSEAMAAVAVRNLAPYPNATVEVVRFEDWRADEPYDLLVSGQAFHWVEPEIRYALAADALQPGGTIALFWNLHVDPVGDGTFEERVQDVYREHAPELAHSELALAGGLPTPSLHAREERDLVASGRFTDASTRSYPWSRTLDRANYLALLATHSPHAVLEPDRRERLHGAIGELIDADFDGRVEMRYVAQLVLGRRI